MPIDTTNLDADGDKLKPARPAILAMAQLLNLITGSGGAVQVGFMPAGAGAVATNSEAALRKYPHASQYTTNADYVAAVKALATGEYFTSSGAIIHRLADRLFVGHAAGNFYGDAFPDGGTSWLGTAAQGPAYLAANATLLVMPEKRRYGIVGATKTSLVAGGNGAISVGAAMINDGTALTGSNGWAFMAEVQHENSSFNSWGVEFAIKNASGVNVVTTPYTTSVGQTIGIQLSGGGDNSFGPLATHPSTAGMVFTVAPGGPGWNTGIQFRQGSLAGAEPEAIALANTHSLRWYEPTGTVGAVIKSLVSAVNSKLTLSFSNAGMSLANNSDKSAFFVATVAADVNRIQVTSALAGASPAVAAAGDDANLDLRLVPKGTGLVRYGTFTASGDVPCVGTFQHKTSDGVVRKVMIAA